MRNNYDVTPLLRQWIGFDKLAHALESAQESQAFPPYNIEKSGDNHYRITLALAGFRQEDLDIELEGTKLGIKGTHPRLRFNLALTALRRVFSILCF